MLTRHGLAVFVHDRAQSILSTVSHINPDLVLIDLAPTPTPGLETLRRIRDYVEAEVLPIAIALPHSNLDTVARAFNAGASEYVVHPPRWAAWQARLRPLLKRHPLGWLGRDREREEMAKSLLHAQEQASSAAHSIDPGLCEQEASPDSIGRDAYKKSPKDKCGRTVNLRT
jgi:DNA-binding response OmpR family regulator